MAPPKKKASPVHEATATHDIGLHTRSRDAGNRPGAVQGCVVCDVLVADGFATYSDGRDSGGGRDAAEAGTPSAGQEAKAAAQPAAPPPTVTIVEEEYLPSLQAVMEAAETFKPGLADKLVPVFEVLMRELAKAKAEEARVFAWQTQLAADLQQIKEAFSVLHNNIAVIYNILTGPPTIRKLGP